MTFPSQCLISVELFQMSFLVMLKRSSRFHQLARGADQPDVKVLTTVSQKTHFTCLTSKTSTETLQGWPLKRVKCFQKSLLRLYSTVTVSLWHSRLRGAGKPPCLLNHWCPFHCRAPQTVQSCLLMCLRLLSRKGEFPQPPLKLSLGKILQGRICQMAVRVDMGAASAGSLW